MGQCEFLKRKVLASERVPEVSHPLSLQMSLPPWSTLLTPILRPGNPFRHSSLPSSGPIAPSLSPLLLPIILVLDSLLIFDRFLFPLLLPSLPTPLLSPPPNHRLPLLVAGPGPGSGPQEKTRDAGNGGVIAHP